MAPEVACAYLADPANRPEWQSSLRRVDDVRGEVGVGQTWVDVTVPGLKPRMETTAYEPGVRWTERGTWGRVRAELTLSFEPDADGCLVTPFVVLAGPFMVVLRPLAPLAIRADLQKAARLLS